MQQTGSHVCAGEARRGAPGCTKSAVPLSPTAADDAARAVEALTPPARGDAALFPCAPPPSGAAGPRGDAGRLRIVSADTLSSMACGGAPLSGDRMAPVPEAPYAVAKLLSGSRWEAGRRSSPRRLRRRHAQSATPAGTGSRCYGA